MSNKTSDENVASGNNKNICNSAERLKQMAEIIPMCDFFKFCMDYDNAVYFANDISEVLAEREQDKKRIKELEELVAKFKTVDYMFRIDSYSNRYDMRRIYFEWLDSIPKQVVIDKIKEYDKKMEEDAGHPNWVVTDRIVMNVLQELLEGRNENG